MKMTQSRLKMTKQNMTQIKSQSPLKELQISLIAPLEISQKTNITTSKFTKQFKNIYSFFILIIFIVIQNQNIGFITTAKAQTLAYQFNANSQCLYQLDGVTLLNTIHQIYSNNICKSCLPYCVTCFNQTDTSCADGNCQNGYFLTNNSNMFSCQSCPVLCKQCSNFTISSCIQCIDSYYFDEYLLKCNKCPFGALTCSGSVILQCLSGFYYDSQSSLCKTCPNNCISCSSSSNCDACLNGFYQSQSGVCSKCGVQNCEYCADNNTCYQCLSGFYLNINGTNNQCLMFNQCVKYCIQCYNTSNSTLVCSRCNDGYYIYGGSCYFGSSFLCVSGYEGPTFAKCQSCSLIAQKSQYSSSTSSTYCLPIMSQSQQTKIQFYNFLQFELCSNPYFKSSLPSSNVSINLIIQPLYQISLRMTIISTSKNWSSHYSSLIDLHNKKFTLISQIVKSGEYFCKTDTNLSKTVFKVQQKYFLSSISSNIKFQINTSSSYSLSVMQLYLQKFLCLSQNCLACYSTYYCSVCQNSYLLEEYNCVSQCSDGYYTNSGLGKCQIQCSVGYYYPNNNQMICQPCQTECISCIGVNICLSCINGYFLDQNQKNLNILTLNTAKVGVCTLNCSKNTTFQDKSLNFCSFCNNPCKTCQNIGSNCTSCLVGYLLFNNQTYLGKCVAQCPNGYYSSFSTIPQCSICSINCLTCQILSNYCTECKTGYFLSNGICSTSCPNKYYKNQFTNRCQSCQNNCQTCQKFPNNCNQCSKGYLLKLNENQLYLLINNSSNNSQTNLNFQSIQLVNMFYKYHNIISKISNFSFGICVNQCPLLYFYHNQTSSKCLKCPQNCQICEQSSQILEIKCKKCIQLSNATNQTFLYAGNCIKLCPSSLNSSQNLLFMDLKTLSCKTCKKPCLTCITDYEGTNCLSCINQYYLLSNKTIQGKCVLRCPIGYYKSQQFSTCQLCPQQCTQCQTQTRCNVCSSGYVFVSLNYTCKYLANNNTLDVCESNFYLSQVLMECLRCNGNCKQCFSQSYFCIQCWDNQFLMVYQGICLDVCSEGYFGITGIIQINFTANGKNSIYSNLSYCKTCPQQCSTCLSLQICSNCKSGYFFYNNSQCLKSCPDSFYPNSIQDVILCQKCPITCTKCVNPSLCSQCNSGMILIYNLCYSACQTGYFLVKNNSIYNSSIQQIKCSACPNSCETCQSYENCQTCKSGYFLSSSILPTLFQCVLECKQGFFKNHLTNQCQKCRYPCLTCKNQILCSSCQSTLQGNYLIYLNQACYQTCPDGYYFYEQPTNNSNINQSIFTCKLCEQSCLLCTSLTQCLKCSSPYFLSVVNNNGNQKSLCVTNCPLQYYSDNIKNQCVKCSPPCVNCYNSIACISCVQNYLLKGTICLPVCPVGSYISENSTNTCQSCPENCLSCQSQNICTVCYSNSYLFSEIQNQSKSIKCIKQCPNSTYLNLDSYSCQTCSVFCKQCINDPFTCTSCHSPLLLQTQRRICVQNCSDFLYQFNGFCMQCPKWCSNCANDSYCIKCVTGYLFNGRCETICPDGTYKNNQNFACQDCMTGCLKCKSLSVCLSCSSDQNYTLYSVKCILKPCPQGLFYYVQANQCVTRCDLNFILNSVNANKVKLLTDLINMQCHNPSACCPQGLIQSTDSLYCLERCPSNQLVLLKMEQNYNNDKNISQIVKPVCAPLQQSYIPNQLNNILPDFKLNAIVGANFDQSQKFLSNNNKILLLLLFNYQPLKNLLFNINNTQAVYHNSQQIKSFIQNQLLISLLTNSQSSSNYNFHKLVGSGEKTSLPLSKAGNLVPWQIVQIRSNAVWIQVDISSQMMSLIKELNSLNNNMSSNSISNKGNLNSKNEMLKLSLQFTHPYQSFLSKDKVSNILLPPQSYQQNSFVNFNQLSILRQTNVSSNAGKVLFFLFISFSCIIFLLYLFSHLLLSSSLKKQLNENNQDHSHHLNQKQKQKILKNSNVSLFRHMSIFVNCLQYQQLFYLFCFLSTTFLPVGIEQLFKSYSILHMRLFLTQQKMQVIDFNSNRKLIQSPFQYYKYCGDISFFNNILDAMIIIAVIILSLVFAKIFSIINSWFNNNQNKNKGNVPINSIKKIILKINLKKRKIIQTIMFISMSYLALFSMINVFYKPTFILQSKQPFQVFQLIICYFLMILIMISPVYVFYFQYHNKNQYQNGTNSKKKQLGVSIPLYVYIRKILFVFFLTYYYQNGVYSLCIGMMSTAMIFVIIFWYEPYKNNWRNISAYINQGLLFIVFSLMLILVLNPEYSPFLQIIMIIIITLLILSTLAYPSYCIFNMFYNSFHPEWNEDQQFDKIDGIKQGQQSDNFDQNSDLPQQKQFKQKHDLVTIQPSHISKLPKSIFQRPPLCTNNAGLSEADESQLQDRKKKPVVKNIQNYNIVRLAQKQQKKVKEFKNYVISDDDQNDSQSEEVNNKFQQKNNKNNTSKDPSQYKDPKYQF